MAANARSVKNWFYVAREIDLIRRRRRQLGFIQTWRAEKQGRRK
jgi:hypothetical protein